MSVGLRSYIDETGTYFANIISRSGRNEVQFYRVNSAGSDELVGSDIVKVELQADEEVIDAVWINNYHHVSSTRGKKRTGDSAVPESVDSRHVILAVLISSGDILIFSPANDEPINRIASETKYDGLISSHDNTTIWAIHENNISQIGLDSNKILQTVSLNGDISIAQTVQFKSKNKKSMHMVIGNDLQLVDISKPQNIIHNFPQQNDGVVTKIIQSQSNTHKFYVGKQGSNVITIHDLENPSSFSTLLASEVRNIVDFYVVSDSKKSQDTIMAITDEGVQVFNIDLHSDHLEQSPSGIIKTTFHEQGVLFSRIIYVNNQAIGVWYDGNAPRFTKIDWKFNSIGEIQVPINYVVKNIKSDEQNDLISMPESADIINLSSEVLSKQLSKLLLASKIDKKKVVSLCVTNDDPKNIKETVKLFFESDVSSILSNNLFAIISEEVASDPSAKSSLSIWLKWLLLAHGGSIAKQPEQYEHLKHLQTELTNGMKVLPHLVALQGRLQLLKSQGKLRTQINEDDDEDSEDSESIAAIEPQTAESTIIYASGENDEEDFEDEEIVDAEDDEEDN